MLQSGCLEEQEFVSDLRHRQQKLKAKKNKSGPAPDPAEIEAQVVSVNSGVCDAIHQGRVLSCPTKVVVAPGDFVALTEGNRVKRVLPRKTVLSRHHPGDPERERVVAANIDLVIVVAAAVDPPLRQGLIDRYLIAIEQGGAAPAICVNKYDLADPAAIEAVLKPYRALGMPVVLCSAREGSGVEELRNLIAGKLVVFVGQSGVGKSSLLNALLPEAGAATSAIIGATRKGRHTTTRSQIYDLACGSRVIDTPGVREFGLWKIDPAEIKYYFHDFDAAAAQCRFSDCTHLHEPDCMVRRQVEEGLISAGRYQRYQNLCTPEG